MVFTIDQRPSRATAPVTFSHNIVVDHEDGRAESLNGLCCSKPSRSALCATNVEVMLEVGE